MRYEPGKRSMTTGDAAALCGVNFRTIVRWIEKGYLKAHRLPGRGDYRILAKDFVEFLRERRLPVPPEMQPRSLRVLLVDHDEGLAVVTQRALKRKGFLPEIAVDGFQAGVMAVSLKPAVMVVDPETPGLGGLAALRALRSSPELAGVKVLVVAAMGEAELDGALAAGSDDVLAKPFATRILVGKVARLAGVQPD